MALNEEIIAEVANAFDEIRGEFSPDATLELLNTSGEENEFDVVETIDSGWYLKYDEYRNRFKLQIATLDSSFTETMGKVEAVKVNSNVYYVAAGDRIPPTSTSLFWTLYCTRDRPDPRGR